MRVAGRRTLQAFLALRALRAPCSFGLLCKRPLAWARPAALGWLKILRDNSD